MLFFGRTALVEELVARVIEQPLTILLGPSGNGKSSLILEREQLVGVGIVTEILRD